MADAPQNISPSLPCDFTFATSLQKCQLICELFSLFVCDVFAFTTRWQDDAIPFNLTPYLFLRF